MLIGTLPPVDPVLPIEPPFWQVLSHFNPFFYMVDGFRYGFFGVGDVSPWLSGTIVAACLLALSWLTLWLIKTGYKLRH